VTARELNQHLLQLDSGDMGKRQGSSKGENEERGDLVGRWNAEVLTIEPYTLTAATGIVTTEKEF